MKPRARNPPVDLDVTRERLTKLGLTHAAEQLATWLADAVAEETPPHRFLDRMLERELTARDERRVRTSLVLSALPTGQTLANFDFAFQPALERSRIETLATRQWIRENRCLPAPSIARELPSAAIAPPTVIDKAS